MASLLIVARVMNINGVESRIEDWHGIGVERLRPTCDSEATVVFLRLVSGLGAYAVQNPTVARKVRNVVDVPADIRWSEIEPVKNCGELSSLQV